MSQKVRAKYISCRHNRLIHSLSFLFPNWYMPGFYLLLCLVIMAPLLKTGFILTLDMVFTPKLAISHGISNTYILQCLLHLINIILPGQYIEKLLMFAILLLSGIGMHTMIDAKTVWAKYFAGILYIINPFTYERWMAGQYLVLGGYALLPFLLHTLMKFVRSPDKRTSLQLFLWYLAIASLSLQMLVLGIILGAVVILVNLVAYRKKPSYIKKLVGYGSTLLLVSLIVNSYWLIGVIRGSSPITQTLSAITSKDLAAFTTASNSHVGLLLNVVTMYGFWEERFHRYLMPNVHVVLWISLFIILASVITLGIRFRWKSNKRMVVIMSIVGIIGVVVAEGISAPLTGSLTRFFITKVPFMNGFREPEKFSALLVLAYCYFGGHGVDWIIQKINSMGKRFRELIPAVLLLLPILYVPIVLFGFAGQLEPVNYPASWYQFDAMLERKPAFGKILFLPWNEYMSYNFSPRIIANPAPQFFDAAIISGTNAQFGTVYQATVTPISAFIENQILGKAYETDLGSKLATIHVQYVLLSQGYDYRQYGFLNDQTDLKLISSKPGLLVYLNKAYRRS